MFNTHVVILEVR